MTLEPVLLFALLSKFYAKELVPSRNKKILKQTSKRKIYDNLNLRFGLFRRWLYIIL